MCALPFMPMDMCAVRDILRGRSYDRFYKLQKFAHKRWVATRDMRRASQWLAVMDSIKRRMPR